MNYSITPPNQGRVTLDLDLDTAEILTRAIGLVNSGSLRAVSPDLHDFVDDMVAIIGRNLNHEARRYTVDIIGSQVYVTDLQ